MAKFEVDRSEEFIKSGMTLISDFSSEKYLKKIRNRKYAVPQDRLSRQCGGAGGFDDFVERFGE